LPARRERIAAPAVASTLTSSARSSSMERFTCATAPSKPVCGASSYAASAPSSNRCANGRR
jgi:hypothetical protein